MDPDIDFDDLTDEELDAMESAGASEEAGETPEPTPSPEPAEATPEAAPQETPAPVAEEPALEQPEPAAPPQQRTVPVDEHIATRRRAQEAERRAQEAEAKAQHAAASAEYWRLNAEEGPEAANAYWANYEAHVAQQNTIREREAQVRSEVQQEAVVERLRMAADLARGVYGERFDQAYGRLCAEFGADWVDRKAAEQPNPGKWVVEFHDTKLAPSQESLQKMIAAEAQKQVQEALKKASPPASRANPASSIAHVNSNPTPSPEDLEPDDMTDAQLQAMEREDRKRLKL